MSVANIAKIGISAAVILSIVYFFVGNDSTVTDSADRDADLDERNGPDDPIEQPESIIAQTDVNTGLELTDPSLEVSEAGENEGDPLEPTGNPGLADFDQQLIDEPRDDAWAPQTETLIDSTLRSVPIPSSDIEVTCRTTICRVVVTHDFGLPGDGSPPQWDFGEYGRMLNSIIQSDARLDTVVVSTFPDGGFQPHSISEGTNLVTHIFVAGRAP